MSRKPLDEGSPALEEVAAPSSRWTALLVFAVLLPPIVAFGILFHLTLTVPYQDDYDAILAFASDYEQLSSLPTKILAIATEQHNEYKLGFEHSIVALELEITHHLSFTFLTVLGDLMLLPIGFLLWKSYQVSQQTGDDSLPARLFAFLPISLCFFSLTYWETLNWAMTGLQNTPVILFSLLAIYLVARAEKLTRTLLFLGCLSAGLAAFTSANGFLLLPVGLLIFLPSRAFTACAAWCAAFVLPLAAYLYHYTSVVHPADKAIYLTRAQFFFAFLGCAIPFRWPAALLGAGLLTVFLYAARARFDRINPTAFYFVLWILATAALVAWVRGATGFWVASRYSIYSILLLVFCYAFIAQCLNTVWSLDNQRRFYVTAIMLAFVYCLAADVTANKHLGERRRMVVSGIESYRIQPAVNSPMVDPVVDKLVPAEKELERVTLSEAIQKHIYTLPPLQHTR